MRREVDTTRQRWNAIFSRVAATLLILAALAVLLAPVYGASSPGLVYAGAAVALVVGSAALLTGSSVARRHDREP